MRRLTVSVLLVSAAFGLSVWTGVGPADDWVHTCQVRQAYLDRLEAMRVEVNRLRIQGRTEQQIAQQMVPRRNQATALIRAKMKAKDIRRLDERNQARYGNPYGPTLQWMYARYGGNWHEMVEATMESNGFYDFSCIPWYDL